MARSSHTRRKGLAKSLSWRKAVQEEQAKLRHEPSEQEYGENDADDEIETTIALHSTAGSALAEKHPRQQSATDDDEALVSEQGYVGGLGDGDGDDDEEIRSISHATVSVR